MRLGLSGLLTLAMLGAVAAADFPLSTTVCLVPVVNGTATEADAGQAWRMKNNEFYIAGLPGPVFTPTNRGGAWTIIDHTFQPYGGPFPRTLLDLDNWVAEPWSGRVVATRQFPPGQGLGLWTIAPGGHEFVAVPLPDGLDARTISAPFLVPRQQQTIVMLEARPFIVGVKGLIPWMSGEQMQAAQLPGLLSLHYSAELAALVAEDSEGWIHVLPDGGDWQRLDRAKDDKSYVTGLFDIDGESATLLHGGEFVDIIRKSAQGEGFEMERLASQRLVYSQLRASAELDQVLRYDSGGLFDPEGRWFRRDAFGYEEIAGGRIEAEKAERRTLLQEIAGAGLVILPGRDAMYLYDGVAMSAILDETGLPLKGPASARRFPAIDRVLLWMNGRY